MAVPFGKLGEHMRPLAQAFERRYRGQELDQKMLGRVQIRVGERDSRIGRMQVATLTAPEPAELLAEGGERMSQAIGAAPRPRPTQHRALERCDGARMRALSPKPDERMLEQRKQRDRRKAFDHGLRGEPGEHAGGRIGEHVAT